MARAIILPTDAPPTAHESPGPAGAPAGLPAVPTSEATVEAGGAMPRHVAIIMDGNRRWARQRGLSEVEGHAAGVEAIRRVLRHSVRRGVPVLTLYAFSRENWARTDSEVEGLFGLLEASLAEGGVLIYETFMMGNEKFGRPSNPAFLLRPGELLDAFKALTLVAFEQGIVERPKKAAIQRLCAIRAPAGSAKIAP